MFTVKSTALDKQVPHVLQVSSIHCLDNHVPQALHRGGPKIFMGGGMAQHISAAGEKWHGGER